MAAPKEPRESQRRKGIKGSVESDRFEDSFAETWYYEIDSYVQWLQGQTAVSW